jgi:hypothetical protein
VVAVPKLIFVRDRVYRGIHFVHVTADPDRFRFDPRIDFGDDQVDGAMAQTGSSLLNVALFDVVHERGAMEDVIRFQWKLAAARP